MNQKKITIIGCGLIGGSIALALKHRRSGWSVACLDLPDRLPAMCEAGVADEVGTLDDLPKHLRESSLVVLAAPVQAILEHIERIAPHLREGTIVTDVGSTKAQIMAKARACIPTGIQFVGGHPMAGSERSGVEAADPLLFSDRVYTLCPYEDTPPEVLVAVIDLVEDLLARPVTIDPEEHDRMMAMVSHLPCLISVALMHAALQADARHGMLETLAGRGFLDVTRLAASEFEVWSGILATNKQAIEEAFDNFGRSLSLLRGTVASGDAALLWEQVSRTRRKMGLDSLPRMRKPDLRGQIDRYDKQLLGALANRMRVVRKIGKLKFDQAAPVRDPERERRLIAERAEWGKTSGLLPELIEELFEVILRHSARIQSSER
jgi:prephenate dehydrogenase